MFQSLHGKLPSFPSRLFPLLLLLPLLPLSLFPLHPIPPSHPAPPSNRLPEDACFFTGNPTASPFFQFASRSLCLSSSVCLLTNSPNERLIHTVQLSRTKCHFTRADYSPITTHSLPHQQQQHEPAFPNTPCPLLQREHVLCAHGHGLAQDNPQCPRITTLPWSSPTNHNATWLEHLSIIVPDYPYLYNIYHYANLVSTLSHAIHALPQLLSRWPLSNVRAEHNIPYFRQPTTSTSTPPLPHINILFRTPSEIPPNHHWKHSLLSALLAHHNLHNISVLHLSDPNHPHLNTPQTHFTCVRNALILGRHAHCNAWPFPNTTAVPLHGLSVPADAINFRRAVYSQFSIKARLPHPPTQSASPTAKHSHLSELPPLVLGYAQRVGNPRPDNGYYYGGAIRRFSRQDEAWFQAMLRNETNAVGARLKVFSFSGNESLAEQVRQVTQVGFIVGIHGANLVNAIFMHPFGALFELLPAWVGARCYIAGSNSGLAYFKHESSENASPQESGCDPDDGECEREPRQRMVKMSNTEDREKARQYVREGLRHLKYLHATFPGGIPVTYNADTLYFDVNVPESKT